MIHPTILGNGLFTSPRPQCGESDQAGLSEKNSAEHSGGLIPVIATQKRDGLFVQKAEQPVVICAVKTIQRVSDHKMQGVERVWD